jgi:hypothetical protein
LLRAIVAVATTIGVALIVVPPAFASDVAKSWEKPETPLLTLMHADDPWFRVPFLKGSCANKIAGRKNAGHVVVPGEAHGTYASAAARNAVAVFLAAQAPAP